MPENQILVPLKIDLQISSDALDSYLLDQIRAAQDYIKTEGITLKPESTGDQMLVAMYAAYLYRKRRSTGDDSKMPRMLRWALNNRLFQEKISEG
jgi:hypothetical protein